MAILTPKEKSFKFKKIAIIAFCLLIFDAFIFGTPFFGLIIMFFLVVASGISAIIFLFRDKQISKLYAIKALIYFTGFIGIIGVFKFNVYIGGENANIVIKAINSYYADTGFYPDDLNQLIPNYLDNIPNCAYRIMDYKYRYYLDQENANLMWTVIPPWGRRNYNFLDAEWTYRD
jgi:hypothetical protein